MENPQGPHEGARGREERVLHRFLSALLADELAGGLRQLSAYQLQFPEAADLVETWYRRHVEGEETRGDRRGAPSSLTTVMLDTPSAAEPGSIGPYRLGREVGRGGQGRVHLAVDTRLGRTVALKILRGGHAENDLVLKRFQREAVVAARLEHPHICTVYESGVHDGVAFIAMQYVEGVSLAGVVAKAREDGTAVALPRSTGDSSTGGGTGSAAGERARTLRFVEDVARALHEAHEVDIVHRDIKPGNVMVDVAGQPVILDFGLARQEDPELSVLTQTGDFFGTPAYMAPEQIDLRHPCDRRADVWALGVTLFELLALRLPFREVTRQALQAAILESEPPRLRRMVPGIPRDLEVVTETALQKDPAARYQTALDLAEDLRAVREGRAIRARPVGAWTKAWRWSRREPVKALLLAGVVVSLVVIGHLVSRALHNRDRLRQADRVREVERREELLCAAYVHLAEERYPDATSTFEDIRGAGEDSPAAAAGWVLTAISEGSTDSALERLKGIPGSVLGGFARAQLAAWALKRKGQLAEAQAVLAGAGQPVRAFDHYVLGRRLAMEADPDMSRTHRDPVYQEAFDALRSAVLLSPRPRLLYFHALASAAGRARRRDVLRNVASAMVRHWPRSPWAWRSAGSAYAAGELFDEAIAAYRHTLRLDPRHRWAPMHLGVALLLKDRLDEAWDAFELALSLGYDPDVAHANMGTLRARQRRFAEARDCYQKAAAAAPSKAKPHVLLGITAERTRDFAQAERHFRDALAREPDNGAAWNGLGRSLVSLGKPKDARAAYEAGLRRCPSDASLRYNLAVRLAAEGRGDEAVVLYREVLERDPAQVEARHNIGSWHLTRGEHEKAERAFREVIRRAPDYTLSYVNLASLYAAHRPRKDAGDTLRDIVARRPRDPTVLCYAGRFLVQRGFPRDGAAALAKGHELASKQPKGAIPSAQWLALARKAEDATRRMESEKGPFDPEGDPDVYEAARRAERFVLLATWYRDAFVAKPELARRLAKRHRFHAAAAAVRATWGHGDGAELGWDGRATWNAQAVAWLREDLAAWRARLEVGRVSERRLTRELEGWKRPLRWAASMRAAGWSAVWDEFASLLDEVR